MIHLRIIHARLAIRSIQPVGGEGRSCRVFRKDLIKAVIGNLIHRAEVPFPDLPGDVSDFPETLSDGLLRIKSFQRTAVRFEAEAALIPTGQKSPTGWDALRRGNIAVRAAHPVGSELIEMGRFQIIIDTSRSDIRPTMVVRENENDVGLFRSGEKRAGQEYREDDEHREAHSEVTYSL